MTEEKKIYCSFCGRSNEGLRLLRLSASRWKSDLTQEYGCIQPKKSCLASQQKLSEMQSARWQRRNKMLLTDEDIRNLYEKPNESPLTFARAVIAEYEVKLREQAPVYQVWRSTDNCNEFYSWDDCDKSDYDLASEQDRRILFKHPAPIPEGWISVDDALPEFGRTPILVAVSWVKYGEHDDGTPTEATGVDVTEGEYVPAHGEAGGYFDSYQGSHGDSQHITHWQPLPKPPMAAARSGE